jgi:hypothetical protein
MDLDALRQQADSDESLLARCAAELAAIAAHQQRVLALRDETALRLREAGMPMARLARLARCTDSYLARRLIALGSARRITRGEQS